MTLRISGHSDDIVILEGFLDEELCTDINGVVKLLIGEANSKQGQDSHGLRVDMTYGAEAAIWSATISQIDEDIKCPWSVSLTFQGYSPTVTIDCPEGTPVHFWNSRSKKWQNTNRREEED